MKKITLIILFLLGAALSSFGQASLCEDAVSIALPYATTDDTANYADTYFGTPGDASLCGTPNGFLYGNDVVYSYTATFDGTVNASLTTDFDNVGMFVYSSCANIGVNCLAGITNQQIPDPTTWINDFPVTFGETYYFVISTWAPPETVFYTFTLAQNTCVNAVAAYTVVSDCSAEEQFLVAVDVTSLGSATSLTLVDDQSSATQTVTAPGLVTFGPYPNGTIVTIDMANDQDANCFLRSIPLTQMFCAPVNNFCSTATDLALEVSPINGTTINATSQNIPPCYSFMAESPDVYYKIEVPDTYTLTISESNLDYDGVVSVYIGSCDNQLELLCEDNDDASYVYGNFSGETKTFYWVQDGFNGGSGNFTLEWRMTDCVVPEALYTVVPDCENGQQFLVTADVYTMGSATSVTVTDNQSSGGQTLSETGQLQFGPYTNGTEVLFTVTNDDDANCFLNSQTLTQYECPPSCTNATVYFDYSLDCANTQGYFVNVNIADLGTATAVSISDNQGSDVQGGATGVYQFGPYASYTTILFTVSGDDDATCVATYEVQSGIVCAPANDSCATAIALAVGTDLESGSVITTSVGATLSPELPYPECGNMFFNIFGKDIWHTVVVPSSGNITIETTSSGEEGFAVINDSVLQIYSGDCSSLTPISCDNDGGEGFYSLVSLTGRIPGEVLYIRAFGANGAQGSFTISAYDSSLGNPSFDSNSFTAYPNPVKDVLHLSSKTAITNVRVYNLPGQEIYAKAINVTNSDVDMSHLSNGTYLVKVETANGVKTIKVIKE